MRRRTSPRRSLVAVAMKAPLSCLPIARQAWSPPLPDRCRRPGRRCHSGVTARSPVQAGATAAARRLHGRRRGRPVRPQRPRAGSSASARKRLSRGPCRRGTLRPLEDVPVQLRGGVGVAGRREDAAELDARMGGGPGRTRCLGGCERAPLELFGARAGLRSRGRMKRARRGRTRRGRRSLLDLRDRARDGTRPWRRRRRPAARRPTHRAASPGRGRRRTRSLGVAVRVRRHGRDRGGVSHGCRDVRTEEAGHCERPVVSRLLRASHAPAPPTRRRARRRRHRRPQARASPAPARLAACPSRSLRARARARRSRSRRRGRTLRSRGSSRMASALEPPIDRNVVRRRGERELEESPPFGDALRQREVPARATPGGRRCRCRVHRART